MSVEFAIEKYPIQVTLKNDETYEVRPIRHEDGITFRDFFEAIPTDEKLFVTKRLTDGSKFHEWNENLDFETSLPLVALFNGKIVADVTLHQRRGGWKRHIGLVSMLVHPEHRDIGMARALISELVEIAGHAGLAKLEVEFNGERQVAIQTFAALGFTELMRVRNYVRDMQANDHDYVLMGMDIVTDEEFANAV